MTQPSDIRARLADDVQDLIAKHNEGYAPPREQIEQVIDALLSLPGIAIVDLSHIDQIAERIARPWPWNEIPERGREVYRNVARRAVLAAAADTAEQKAK